MAHLTIDLGCGDYDIVRPLKDGAVRAEGLEINFITINRPPEVHWRMGMHQEFDAAEMSFGSFVAGKARGDYPFIGIPAFVYRKFRHSNADRRGPVRRCSGEKFQGSCDWLRHRRARSPVP